MHSVIRQDWEESERGWGVRPDGYSLHRTEHHRRSFIRRYWANMPDAPPDEYSRPSGDPFPATIDAETYTQLARTEDGIRCY